MKNQALTLTVIANMTSNYGETLGNIASVQKVYRNGQVYAMRSKESLKNALLVQSGLYGDLQVEANGATQKKTDASLNASNCRALEGGYMNTSKSTKIRKSSFYLTDAVATEPFINEARFHNNLHLAKTYAAHNDLNVQDDADKVGLMPYQYEYNNTIKKYSITIDLDRIGFDDNYNLHANAEEKIHRVNALIDAVQHLSLVVKGNLDNAEPLFIVGGIGKYKTHYFDNVVDVTNGKLSLLDSLKTRITQGYKAAYLDNAALKNGTEISNQLDALSMDIFFNNLKTDVENYYAGN